MHHLLKGVVCVLLCCLFLTKPSYSQNSNTTRSCSSMDQHLEKMNDPAYAEDYNQRLKKARTATSQNQNRALCANPVTIPVAVHYQGAINPDPACLKALAENQIAIVNADFQGLNVDVANWVNTDAPNFPGVSHSETCVQFCIASKNHPNGFNLVDGDLAITINQTNGQAANAWSGYLNIFVFDFGALGESPLGGLGNGDGVTVDRSAFGTGAGCTGFVPVAPYNLGRTLTHEIGHYFNLDHI